MASRLVSNRGHTAMAEGWLTFEEQCCCHQETHHSWNATKLVNHLHAVFVLPFFCLLFRFAIFRFALFCRFRFAPCHQAKVSLAGHPTAKVLSSCSRWGGLKGPVFAK
jgi:hypothetical protein